ncbi:NADH dehydrogenase [ubiquinone] iron-sulfur protein 6, mitochondrial, partial [Syzygium oleosum]|uniref:NADH dehydrogenase [ubiquinone] iron-sulfur protein 6, mitochondrial n=1 Tax=Syzygium oleosum TaxID=219896 RepID=UPI0024BB9F9A
LSLSLSRVSPCSSGHILIFFLPFCVFSGGERKSILPSRKESKRSMASNLWRAAIRSSRLASTVVGRSFSSEVPQPSSKFPLISEHTAKWMQDTSKKSPMELINDVPPIKVEGRIVACEGDSNPALGHPIEFICLDLDEPAICKYCGLRYIQEHHH